MTILTGGVINSLLCGILLETHSNSNSEISTNLRTSGNNAEIFKQFFDGITKDIVNNLSHSAAGFNSYLHDHFCLDNFHFREVGLKEVRDKIKSLKNIRRLLK